jgi:release factor glutamine methyltransferase
MQSLRRALADARNHLEAGGIDDAGLEAEVLLRHALDVSRPVLYIHLDDTLSTDAASRFETYIERRLAREPAAYITGHREFYNLDLAVTPATLIPRPDTETLVDVAIELAKGLQSEMREMLTIADIGTGSGAIAIALATALPRARIIATDSSPEALQVAEANARHHGVVDSIEFRLGDLLQPLTEPVDLIVANLPYVATDDYLALEPEVRDYEPRSALDGGPDGLDVIRRLLAMAPQRLSEHGAIALEFGAGQTVPLETLASKLFPAARTRIHTDLAGRPRVISIRLT